MKISCELIWKSVDKHMWYYRYQCLSNGNIRAPEFWAKQEKGLQLYKMSYQNYINHYEHLKSSHD